MRLSSGTLAEMICTVFSLRSLNRSRLLALVVVVLLPITAVAGGQSRDASSRRQPLLGLVYSAAARYGVDPRLLDAVIQTESAYRTDVTSSAGAVGLMQLMPGTAHRYGVTTRFDPVQNVIGGTRYLRDLLLEFDLVSALAAYNAGEGGCEAPSWGPAVSGDAGVRAQGARSLRTAPAFAGRRQSRLSCLTLSVVLRMLARVDFPELPERCRRRVDAGVGLRNALYERVRPFAGAADSDDPFSMRRVGYRYQPAFCHARPFPDSVTQRS